MSRSFNLTTGTFFILLVVIVITISQLSLSQQLQQFAALSGPPPGSGKQFVLLPPNASLPSGVECASRVRKTTWEPRPQNTPKNQYIPVKGTDFTIVSYNGSNNGIWIGDHPQRANVLQNRLDGNFTGTTDEILQWAACKWGVDEDSVRAQAVVESNWDMAANGDNGESFGILQVRNTSHATAFPGAQKSTAFNADYTYMRWRLCFEGLVDYLSQTGAYAAGDPWGCMGVWYTGNWYGSGGGGSASGAQAYINAVKSELNARKWDSWVGVQITSSAAPTQPTVTNIPTATQAPITPILSTPVPGMTNISLAILLHGLGRGGDNVNPNSGGNANPIRKVRPVKVELYDTSNQLVLTKQGTVTFFGGSGIFAEIFPLGNVNPGFYTTKVSVPGFLQKTIDGIMTIPGPGQPAVSVALVAGDSNGDNKLSILDYNMILDCFSDLSPARNCTDANKKLSTDLTDDGSVNQFDYNLFLREMSVQSGG